MGVAVSAAPGCKPGSGGEAEHTSVAIGQALSQTCVTVQRGTGGLVADTQVAAGDPARLDKNYVGSWTANAGVVAGGARQTLMRFDLATVPVGFGVVSASLTLSQINDATAVVRLHRISAAWDESTVTWNSFGGAYDPAVVTSFPNGGPSYVGPVVADVTALAQAWINDPSTNFGLLLEQDPVGATRFWTSDDPSLTDQPMLQICYAAPTCSDGIQDQGERGVDCGGPCPLDCPHPPATSVVSAGDRAASPSYSVVYTFGQPTQNQDKSTSPNYRVQGGLIGANGSLP